MEKNTDTLKFEVARELGLAEKVLKFGWKSLSAKETGRIGGLVSKKRKLLQGSEKGHV
ncbi:MAG: small, acid-soluble spore protein, alpha/beta type [Acetivibrionales bacterium]|jgi:small acid-soluble spore protein F (minor alpha/beta-type SASP)